MLEKKLENIPPNHISSPELYVAVPVMQYISYCSHKDCSEWLYGHNCCHDGKNEAIAMGFL